GRPVLACASSRGGSAMNRNRKSYVSSRVALGFVLLISAAAAGFSLAQTDNYPSRTITLLVPFPPGGSSDTVIRPIAQKVAASLGQTIVIDNRSGAGGNVAALATKQAAPDG